MTVDPPDGRDRCIIVSNYTNNNSYNKTNRHDLNRSSVSAELGLGAAAASATATLLAGTLHQLSERVAALILITALLRLDDTSNSTSILMLIATLLLLHLRIATAAATTPRLMMTTRLTRALG